MNEGPKEKLLEHLAAGIADAKSSLDAETGKFLAENGGWAVTRQDIIFPLAVLYNAEGTKWYRDKSLLDIIALGGSALRNSQDSDGRWEFVKIDGSKWGKTFMPWSTYHWLEAFVLVRDELDQKTRKQWERGLRLCYEGLTQECKQPKSHNIPTWNGMSLVRAGMIFGCREWEEVGRAQCLFSAAQQHEDGFWPEGDGPTNGYNNVYVHALGLYYAFTGDKNVLKCLERACRFHATFVYPDASGVETVDGRVKYNASPRVIGLPGHSFFPQGRRLISLITEALIKSPGSLSPHIASYIQHGKSGSTSPCPWEINERTVYADKALIARRHDWFVCVSGYSPAPEKRTILGRQRWIMTRSNCLSVWHEQTGLLIGGGNSKHDPLFATFDVGENGSRRLEPDEVFFRRSRTGEIIKFRYGHLFCLLRLRWKNKKSLEVTFELPGDTVENAVVQAGFTMRLKEGETLRWCGNGKSEKVGESCLTTMSTTFVNWGEPGSYKQRLISGNGWTLEMPPETNLYWPAYPFNPYAIDNAAPPQQAVAAVSIGFLKGRKRTFLLTVN